MEKKNQYFVAGIDVGSVATKAVILRNDERILGHSVVPTGAASRKASEISLSTALTKAQLEIEDMTTIVSTGYGREIAPFAKTRVTEIKCHARGAWFISPETGTVLDVGGQDSKVIQVNNRGNVSDFMMNDKCAAGTGRFLEVMARAMEIDFEDLADLSLKSKRTVKISSTCAVFAETEVVNLVAQGTEKEDIIHGIHHSIAARLVGMIRKVGIKPKITMTGGVSKNASLVRAIEEKLGADVWVPEEPQIIGALGAALIGLEKSLKSRS